MNVDLTMNDTILRSQSEIKYSEEMSRYLDKRVLDIEKAFNSLDIEFIGYARRTAKIRNNGDKIIEILSGYVCRQLFNSSTNECIKSFCSTMSIIEDLRNIELNRIKVHIIDPMQKYTINLKVIKAEIKKEMDARKKELVSLKKLEKSRTGGGIKEAKARNSTEIAIIQAATQSERLLKMITEFEKKKLEHVQSILRSFIHIEMLWHMRALERYTEAYATLRGIDCVSDLNEFLDDLSNFRSQDHLLRSNNNLNMSGLRAQSMGNLTTIHKSSQDDVTGRNEMRTSVTFEDEHQRSRSFQHPTRILMSATGGPRGDARPPVASVQRVASETDSSEYTDDGTTTPSRTVSARSGNRGVREAQSQNRPR